MPVPAHLSAFAHLPDDARLWLLALTHDTEAAVLAPEVESLLGRWRHKGVQYQGAWTLLERRILAIAENTAATHEVSVEARYIHGTPPTVNHAALLAGRLGSRPFISRIRPNGSNSRTRWPAAALNPAVAP